MSPKTTVAYMGGISMGKSDVPQMLADGLAPEEIRATLWKAAPAMPWSEEDAFHWGYATGAEGALQSAERGAL